MSSEWALDCTWCWAWREVTVVVGRSRGKWVWAFGPCPRCEGSGVEPPGVKPLTAIDYYESCARAFGVSR